MILNHVQSLLYFFEPVFLSDLFLHNSGPLLCQLYNRFWNFDDSSYIHTKGLFSSSVFELIKEDDSFVGYHVAHHFELYIGNILKLRGKRVIVSSEKTPTLNFFYEVDKDRVSNGHSIKGRCAPA